MTRMGGEDQSAASFLDWLATPAKHVPLPAPAENRDGEPTERVIFLPGGGKIIFSSGGDFDPGIRPAKKTDKTGPAGNRNPPQKLGHIPLDSSVLPGPSGLANPGGESHARGASSKHSHRRLDPSQSSGAHFWSAVGDATVHPWLAVLSNSLCDFPLRKHIC